MNRFVLGLTFALLFTLSSSGNAGLQEPPDTTTKRSESDPPFPAAVKFDLYRSYLIVVPCSSSGQEHLSFVADTGADPTVLDRRAAQKLGLRAFNSGQVVGLAGVARGESAILPELRLGPVRATNLKVLVSDLSFLEKALHVPIDGMIGIDVLGKVPFMIDYKARLISFSEAESLDRSVPYQVVGHFPTVEITLNGGRFRLMVDTGASALMLFSSRVEGQVAQHDGCAVTRSTSLSGIFQRRQVSLGHAILGDADLGMQIGFVVANQKDVGTDFDGLLSPVALGIPQIAIDPRHGVIRFSPDTSVKANFTIDEMDRGVRPPQGSHLQ